MKKRVSKVFTILVCTMLTVFLVLSLVTFCGAELVDQRVPKDQINFRAKLGATIITLAHPCGTAVHRGIEKETKIQNFEYTIYDANWSTETLITQIEAMTRKDYDVILVYPIDPGAIAMACKKAEEKGIIVICIQSDSAYPTSGHVATNHYLASRAAAEKLAQQLNGEGKVVLIGSSPGDYNGMRRENGYKDVLADYPGIEIVAFQLGDWQRKKAKDVTESLLARHRDIDAIACVNDEMALGAIGALKAAGYSVGPGPGQVKVWGFDGEKEARDSVLKGEMAGTVFNDFVQNGIMAVDLARALLNGGIKGGQVHLELRIPFTIVTKENIDEIPADKWF